MNASLSIKRLMGSKLLLAVTLAVLFSAGSALAQIKQVRSTALTILPASGSVNVLSIDFIAPLDGFVAASAVGYCNMLSPAVGPGYGQAVIGLSTAPLSTGNFPQAFLMLPDGLRNGSGWQQSWATSDIFPVFAGPNTLFVNATATNGGGWSCAAVLTVSFSTDQL